SGRLDLSAGGSSESGGQYPASQAFSSPDGHALRRLGIWCLLAERGRYLFRLQQTRSIGRSTRISLMVVDGSHVEPSFPLQGHEHIVVFLMRLSPLSRGPSRGWPFGPWSKK